MKPAITIALPFHNSAATLELAVRSLLNQSFGDFELLLCNDGSDDQGLTIAQSFSDPRIICWTDGKRRRLAVRLNECIDRARGRYIARMDADDISYADRFAKQFVFLEANADVDLCGAGALVFGKQGLPRWRYNPPLDHGAITRSALRGFPLWHPLWMGRTDWFRRWRYEQNSWLAQDQELLLRSYQHSRFANLPQVLLGYRKEQVSLRKLFRYKVLHVQQVSRQPGAIDGKWQKLQLLAVSGIRFGANCTARLSGFEHRFVHQATKALTTDEIREWTELWNVLSLWYPPTSNERFHPSSVAPREKERQEHA
jgi:glycosyltransferase involved in cell wall biosynthesis